MNAGRVEWIDRAKGIGIALVVYGHVARGLSAAGIPADSNKILLADSMIYSFHMPLFFFLSGVSFHRSFRQRGAQRLIAARIDTLLYPYLVWSLLQTTTHVILSHWTNQPMMLDDLMSIPWQPIGQFWFLFALFWIFAFNAVLAAWFGSVALPLSLGLAMVLYISELPTLPCAIPQASANLIFFNVGWLATVVGGSFITRQSPIPSYVEPLHSQSSHVLTERSWTPSYELGITSLVLLSTVFAVAEIWFHHVGWRYNHAPAWARLSLALIGISTVVCFAGRLEWRLSGALAWLGRHAMPIYLMHILVAAGMRIALREVFGVASVWLYLIVLIPAALLLPIAAFRIALVKKAGWLFAPPGGWLRQTGSKMHKPPAQKTQFK